MCLEVGILRRTKRAFQDDIWGACRSVFEDPQRSNHPCLRDCVWVGILRRTKRAFRMTFGGLPLADEQEQILRFAQDDGCGLPLRSRPQSAVISATPAAPPRCCRGWNSLPRTSSRRLGG